jgi:predicted enzyme related to lactoylglutathione lyase
MARALGIGGVFFKSPDPKALGKWYRDVLGVPYEDGCGGNFPVGDAPTGSSVVWAPFPADTDYFAPTSSPFMVNLMVDDLDGALEQVEAGGATLVGDVVSYDFGRFGWFLDPDGNKVELWQPIVGASDEAKGS